MRLAHALDLRLAKGRPPSSLSIFAYSNSLAMVISPTLACSRAISSSRSSPCAVFQRTLRSGKGPVTPFRKPMHRDAEIP